MVVEKWRLRLAGFILVIIGVGNNSLPPKIQSIAGIDYLILALITFCVVVAIHFKRVPVSPIVFTTVGIYTAIVALGVTSVSSSDYVTAKLLGFIVALVLIVGPQLFRNTTQFRSSAITIMVVLTAITSFAVIIAGEYTQTGRISVWEISPIGVSRSGGLLASIGITLSLWPKLGPKRRLAGLSMVGVGLFATALTGTRGPLLGFAAAVVVLLLILMRIRKLSLTGLILITSGIASGIGLAMSQGILNISRLTSSDTSGRNELWTKTIQVIRENPIGIGWGRLAQHVSGWPPEDGDRLYPHNVFLEIAVEGGIIGLALFIVIITWVLFRGFLAISRTAIWRDAIPMVLLVFSLVNAMFSSDLIGNRLMWLGVGLCLAAISDRTPAKDTSSIGAGSVDCTLTPPISG